VEKILEYLNQMMIN